MQLPAGDKRMGDIKKRHVEEKILENVNKEGVIYGGDHRGQQQFFVVAAVSSIGGNDSDADDSPSEPEDLLSMNTAEVFGGDRWKRANGTVTGTGTLGVTTVPVLNTGTATFTTNTAEYTDAAAQEQEAGTEEQVNINALNESGQIFGKPPDSYTRKPPTFSNRRPKLPVVNVCVGDTGVTLKGILDSGAVLCCMSMRAAVRAGVMPWDGSAGARTANGDEMRCYGIANGIRIFIDGHEQLVDFLVCDLGAGLDFLLGWDYLQHYEGRVCPKTGALRAKDVNGTQFISASRYQYTSLAGAVYANEAGTTTDHSEVGKKRLHAQLKEIDEISELERRLHYATQVYNVRISETHEAFSRSAEPRIKALMAGDWKDDQSFMTEVNADRTEVWGYDSALTGVRDSLQQAAARVKQCYQSTSEAKKVQVNAVMKGSAKEENEAPMTWKTVGNLFGQTIGKMASFQWTRSVLNQTNKLLQTQ
jgi:hypothetical protein